MFRGFAIFTLFVSSLPAPAAPELSPLRHWHASILETQAQGKLADARSACDTALSLAENPAADAVEQATLFTTCGNLWSLAGELTRSRALLESALTLWQKVFGATHSQVAATSLDLARLHRLAGRYELSEQHARRALSICELNFGPGSLMLNDPLLTISAAQIM